MEAGFPVTAPALTVAVSTLAPSCTVQLPTLATPFTPVVAFAPVTAPPPLATVNVTATLGTGKFAPSRTTTAGAMLRANPASPVWPSPALTNTLAGAPGCTAVAVKVTGLPVIPDPATVPVSVFSPAPGPSVQLPTVATPFASLCDTPPDTLPPPPVTANVTVTAGTTAPSRSRTWTAGGTATGLFVAALCPSPDSLTTDAGGPAIAVAVNVTGATLAPTIEAWTCCGAPAVGPRVHSIVVTPAASVVPLGLDRLPPPKRHEERDGQTCHGTVARIHDLERERRWQSRSNHRGLCIATTLDELRGRLRDGNTDVRARLIGGRDDMRSAVGDRGHQPGRRDAADPPVVGGPPE